MALEILGLAFAAGGVFLKLADFGGIPPSAEQEMYAARILLDVFKDTVLEAQSSRDRLVKVLTRTTKQQVDRHLSHAYRIAELYEKALGHHIVADEVLQFADRAAWMFKNKRKVETYLGVLGTLQTTLERLCEDMARLEATRTDLPADEKPLPRRKAQANAARVAVTHDTKRLAETMGNSEGDLSPGTANRPVESVIPPNFKLETSIAADLKRRFEQKPGVLPPPRIEVSITADLKRRFTQRMTY